MATPQIRRSVQSFDALAVTCGSTAFRDKKNIGLFFAILLGSGIAQFSGAHAEQPMPPEMIEPHRELWNSIAVHFSFLKEHTEVLVTFHRDSNAHITDVVIEQGPKAYRISGQELSFAKYPEPGHTTVTFIPEGEYGVVIVKLPYYETDYFAPDNVKFASMAIRNMSSHTIEKP